MPLLDDRKTFSLGVRSQWPCRNAGTCRRNSTYFAAAYSKALASASWPENIASNIRPSSSGSTDRTTQSFKLTPAKYTSAHMFSLITARLRIQTQPSRLRQTALFKSIGLSARLLHACSPAVSMLRRIHHLFSCLGRRLRPFIVELAIQQAWAEVDHTLQL